MDTNKRKNHWDNIYETKNTNKVSWFQGVPTTSLKLIDDLNLPKTTKIIDVGCGDSCLPDFLINNGYINISALDISTSAIKKSKDKMKAKAEMVNWIVADITTFLPNEKYNVWHDRAVFHFLTEDRDIDKYIDSVTNSISDGGFLIIITFSDNGPDQCSGLIVKQYSEEKLTTIFSNSFEKINCFYENHETPSGSSQNFIFCIFRKT